ncbi:MAG: hypothetical protein ACRDI2_11700 [Chloroflexota bacterium]
MAQFRCPYLSGKVDLTPEREQHITEHHPDLLPQHFGLVVDTLADPDQVRRSRRSSNARLFTRWFPALRGGKYVIVVVIAEPPPRRSWVITAYMAGRLAGGDIEWQRS